MQVDERTLKVYRNELKYYVNLYEYKRLSQLLSQTLKKDQYLGDSGDYWIRSLYFDSITNSDYEEKECGLLNRKKVRLRIYSTKSPTVKLEIKNRTNQYMLKETVTIRKEDAIALSEGRTEVLLQYNNSVANKVYGIMHEKWYQPNIIVDYEREAYVCPVNDIRITFDKNVRVVKSKELFEPDLITTRVFTIPTVILEVKYNHRLPEWIKAVLSSCTTEYSSVSKYCLGRNVTY